MNATLEPQLASGYDGSADHTLRPAVSRYIGGRRGFIDGALPPVGFVAVNAAASGFMSRPDALRAATATAVTTGLLLVIVRLARREPRQQAVRGLVGLAIAAVFTATSGEARDFFLPGIYVDTAWAILLAGSVAVGRPLAGSIHAVLFGRGSEWRRDPGLRRAFGYVTLGWSAVYTTRAVVQTAFYQADEAGLLAASKLVLGWPLTILAATLTLTYLRGQRRAARGERGVRVAVGRVTARTAADRHDGKPQPTPAWMLNLLTSSAMR